MMNEVPAICSCVGPRLLNVPPVKSPGAASSSARPAVKVASIERMEPKKKKRYSEARLATVKYAR
jgi:hypothetical protein